MNLFSTLLNKNYPPCSGIGAIKNEQFEKIWKHVYFNQKIPENTIIKIKKAKDYCTLISVKEGNNNYTTVSILQNPVTFNLNDSIKELKIYTEEQCKNIFYDLLISKFSLKINGQPKN